MPCRFWPHGWTANSFTAQISLQDINLDFVVNRTALNAGDFGRRLAFREKEQMHRFARDVVKTGESWKCRADHVLKVVFH